MDPHDNPLLQHDLAAQEAAAREYQPLYEGALVGEKTSSIAIVEEYAKANPIYVQKTAILPETYSHFRPIRGDGNCGWRAIGFSYFEAMINQADQFQIETEVARITSFNQILISVGGFDRYLFEDMAEETIMLLKELASSIAVPMAAMAILMQKFNDRDSSNAIIYHLRLLASSYLKLNASAYEPFISLDVGLQGFCTSVIEQPNREIEAVGVMLLYNVLLKPLNYVLEIAYLDQSPGPEAQIYRFPEEATGCDPATLGPIISLLFRPDHYDIVYRIASMPVQIHASIPLEVHRATSFSTPNLMSNQPSLELYATLDFDLLSAIPGFAEQFNVLPHPISHSTPAALPTMADIYSNPASAASWLPLSFSEKLLPVEASPVLTPPSPPHPSPAAAPASALAPPVHCQVQPSVLAPTPTSLLISAPLSPPPPPPPPPAPSSACLAPASNECRIRFGKEVWDLRHSSFNDTTFFSNTFKNSQFNRAHYNNPEFHPEEWNPEDDILERSTSKKKGKAKSEI